MRLTHKQREHGARFFWRRVEKHDGCWRWIGGATPAGYGIVYLGLSEGRSRSAISAHKFSYIIHYGYPPKNWHVMHSCDNKACVNPAHLAAGTALQNCRDATARGLRLVGSRTKMAKLTEAIVSLARTEFYERRSTSKALAQRFGVTNPVMHAAIVGKTWKHVPSYVKGIQCLIS